jgi:hypothetical protein
MAQNEIHDFKEESFHNRQVRFIEQKKTYEPKRKVYVKVIRNEITEDS